MQKKAIRPRSERHAQLILATITSSHGSYVVNFWCAFGAIFCSSPITPVCEFCTTLNAFFPSERVSRPERLFDDVALREHEPSYDYVAAAYRLQ
jgi:hypothetical protein